MFFSLKKPALVFYSTGAFKAMEIWRFHSYERYEVEHFIILVLCLNRKNIDYILWIVEYIHNKLLSINGIEVV